MENFEPIEQNTEAESVARSQIAFPLDERSSTALERSVMDFLPDQMLDLVFVNQIHYTTFFDSIDGWDLTTVGAASRATLSGGLVDLETDTNNNDSVELKKSPSQTSLITFGYPSRLRTCFQSRTALAEKSYIVVGPLSGSYYGFKITSPDLFTASTLYGVTRDGSTEATIALVTTVSTSNHYDLEARYTPGYGVVFYVNGVALGTITTNLPTTPATTRNGTLADIKTQTLTGGAGVGLKISFFEYIQVIKPQQ